MLKRVQTFASGRNQKEKEIDSKIDRCYEDFIKKDLSTPDKFYRAICETVQELNKNVGSTQFRVPLEELLKKAFEEHHGEIGKSLTKDEFKNVLKDVIIKTKFTGIGGKDLMLYIFGAPMAALLINHRVWPKPISNDILIPVVTSATVFLLAQLNKL